MASKYCEFSYIFVTTVKGKKEEAVYLSPTAILCQLMILTPRLPRWSLMTGALELLTIVKIV